MCLVVKKGTRSKKLTEDIYVWKQVGAFIASDGTASAVYYSFLYSPMKLNECAIKKSDELAICHYDTEAIHCLKKQLGYLPNESVSIFTLRSQIDQYSEGFHFAINKTRLMDAPYHNNRCQIKRFRIPAGSTVIYDKSGLGVTDKIIYDPEL